MLTVLLTNICRKLLFSAACFLISVMHNKSFALDCTPSTHTYITYIWAFNVDRTSDISKDLTSVTMTCRGSALFNDAFRISDVTLSAKLVEAGFTASTFTIGSEVFAYPFYEVSSLCIWNDASCVSTRDGGSGPPFYLTLKRVGPGPDVAIVAGDLLATIKFQDRRRTTWSEYKRVFEYRVHGQITPRTYTCSLNDYDAAVKMPTLDAIDIMQGATGKITSSKRAFNFRLTCNLGTVVNLQFEGTTLSGTGPDSVLKNQLPRNDNLGIQLFEGNTPLTIGDKRLITNSADAFLNLSYDAYYYYKGGEVNGGPFKSQITFTFTYE